MLVGDIVFYHPDASEAAEDDKWPAIVIDVSDKVVDLAVITRRSGFNYRRGVPICPETKLPNRSWCEPRPVL